VSEIEFSGDSFYHLTLLESRKGRPDPSLRFQDVQIVVTKIGETREKRIEQCGALWKSDNARARVKYGKFKAKERELRLKKEQLARNNLERISSRLSRLLDYNQFNWNLRSSGSIKGKTVYGIATNDNVVYFSGKQVEFSLRRAIPQIPRNRDLIIQQLQQSLLGGFAHQVVRLDISKFYESIPHSHLRKVVAENPRLSHLTSVLISRLLDEFESLTASPVGLPRGVGISSWLAELYLEAFDEQIQKRPGVLFYARYVDDMIVILQKPHQASDLMKSVESDLAALELKLHPTKSADVTSTLPKGFDFLGYKIKLANNGSEVRLGQARHQKYQERLKAAFAAWAAKPVPNSGHNGLLLQRIQFLTSNTRLVGGKSKAVVGAYYSNKCLTTTSDLAALDRFLKKLIKKHPHLPTELAHKLSKESFVRGFEERVFRRYDPKDLQRITAVWHGL
jgi:hypothetical protein